ncbi:hypothetical protein WJX84_001395 [Apatococcus fuscideae]|uniref:Uncharacterized protein n=1 Tax=Apatococcus fuscideae TaxID=2026836 RepID=A0AAW1T7K5_9CHLO
MPPLAHMPPTKVSITARTQAKQARQDGKDCKQMDLALLHGVCKLSAARSSKRKRLHALCSPAKLVKPELAMGDRHKGAARCIIQPYKRNEIAAQAMLKRRRAAEHSATKKRRRELPSSLDPAASVRNFSPSLSRFHPQRAFSFQAPLWRLSIGLSRGLEFRHDLVAGCRLPVLHLPGCKAFEEVR